MSARHNLCAHAFHPLPGRLRDGQEGHVRLWMQRYAFSSFFFFFPFNLNADLSQFYSQTFGDQVRRGSQ